jgi:hypothetical protein
VIDLFVICREDVSERLNKLKRSKKDPEWFSPLECENQYKNVVEIFDGMLRGKNLPDFNSMEGSGASKREFLLRSLMAGELKIKIFEA